MFQKQWSSRVWSEVKVKSLSHVWLFATLWTVAHQAPLSMGFSRQEYWSGLPCPSLGDLSDPWIKPASLTSPALVGGLFTTSTTWEAPLYHQLDVKCFNPYGFFKYLDENSTVGSLLLIVNYSVKPQISLILKIKDDPTILKNFSRFHLV